MTFKRTYNEPKEFKMLYEQFLEELRSNTGIVRPGCTAVSMEIAEMRFIEIANAMLAWRGTALNEEKARPVIKRLISWAYKLDNKLDYRKGILLKGKTGRGKTFLLRAFSEFMKIDGLYYISNGKKHKIQLNIVNAKALSLMYQSDGYKALVSYINDPCLCIDDIGAEADECFSYGNGLNVIDLVLSQREESNLLTFGTTNLATFRANGEEQRYDDRCVSRISDLFNFIPVNHDIDFRQNNN